MVPIGLKGEIESIEKGEFTVEETVATIKTDEGSVKVTMM